MNNIKELRKNDRSSLRLHKDLKQRITKDHGSVPEYFDKCILKDYKISNGKIVKNRDSKNETKR